MAYLGKTVAVEQLLADLRRAARKSGFSVQTLTEVEGLPLLAFSRCGTPDGRSIYLSAGIHGDEPAGPLALLELLEGDLPRDVTWHICPALNPGGLRDGTRENLRGVDLNRDYLALAEEETRAHVQWLRDRPMIDLALFLHEDWETSGFYVYELNPEPDTFSLARQILTAAGTACPIEHTERIDNHEAREGLIRPTSRDLRRQDWPEALYLFTHHDRLSYTLESPSSFALHTRVEALRQAVSAAVESFRTHS